MDHGAPQSLTSAPVLSPTSASGEFYYMESIRLWFNGKKDYATGVKLYSIYGSDMLLKRSFLEPETEYKRKRLEQELSRLLESSKPAPSVISPTGKKPVMRVQIPDPAAPAKGKYVWSEKPDDVEQSIHLRWKPIFVEMMDLISRLGDIAKLGEKDPEKQKEAGRMALRILDLDDQVEEIYQERNHYLNTGKQLEKYPYGEPCLDPVLIPLKLQNHKRYLREQKAKLAENPDNTETAKLVKKHEWFCQYYESILKK